MVSLVNDILDMSRIEAGKIELEDKPFDIRVLADELRNMFQESVEAKNLRFDVELVDFTDYFFTGDEFRLSQVLVNYLSMGLFGAKDYQYNEYSGDRMNGSSVREATIYLWISCWVSFSYAYWRLRWLKSDTLCGD